MYTTINFKSKKELKEALSKGQQLTYFQPGPFGGNEPQQGVIYVEGPRYPHPHRWYAKCQVEGGLIKKVE